jgi:hypothetical protein
VAENQLLLGKKNHFAVFAHLGSFEPPKAVPIAFTTSSSGLPPSAPVNRDSRLSRATCLFS